MLYQPSWLVHLIFLCGVLSLLPSLSDVNFFENRVIVDAVS